MIVERTWRTLKYEWVFLHEYRTRKEWKKDLPDSMSSIIRKGYMRGFATEPLMKSMNKDVSL